jgi:adenylate kinase family enzyme
VTGNDPVLIVTGPPGSGKTTTARAVAGRRDRAVHLESDRFFHFIETGYVEPWRPESHEQNSVVMRIVGDAAGGYADAGYFTIIDGIVSPRWFFEPLRNRVTGLGHAVAYAVLRPPLDVCIARAIGRASDRLADTSVVEQLWRDFADLGSSGASLDRNGRAFRRTDGGRARAAAFGRVAARVRRGPPPTVGAREREPALAHSMRSDRSATRALALA